MTPTPTKPPPLDARIHCCQTCGRQGAQFGLGNAWLCREHLPAGFMPGDRGRG